MNKEIKKADNYFERVKGRANQTKYKYYFFLTTCISKARLGQEKRTDVGLPVAVLVLGVGGGFPR